MTKLKQRLNGCPVEALLKLICQRWSTYILHILLINGPLRFGLLRKNIPNISQKVLTEKLKELEGASIIYRDYVSTVPPQVTYGLTPRGQELIPLLQLISQTAHDWRAKEYL